MTTPNDNVTVSRALLHEFLRVAPNLPEQIVGGIRAALDAPAVEPDAFLHDDGYWTAAKTDAGRALNERLHFAGSTKVAVYTAPQAQQPAPVQEPVVWYDGRKFYATPSAAHMDCADIKALRPLYEAPRAQQPEVEPVAWLPLDTAPKDGTLICLLVNFDDHATEDGPGPHPTIGSNTSENDEGPDEWQFAGWNWEHDRYTQGVGTPVGWLPMAAQQPAPVQEPDQCNWPACQTEQYQQGLADHVANELVGQQPRKVVKLSDSEIVAVRNREFYENTSQGVSKFARAIEQAVWTKLGVTE